MHVEITDKGDWGDSLNFVDKNNVLLGYEYSPDCCEHFGFSIVDSIEQYSEQAKKDDFLETSVEDAAERLKDFVFDPGFFMKDEGPDPNDDGNRAVFRLKAEDPDRVLYLVLWNYHNGYYSHGFEFWPCAEDRQTRDKLDAAWRAERDTLEDKKGFIKLMMFEKNSSMVEGRL